jgi:hypothetical protein
MHGRLIPLTHVDMLPGKRISLVAVAGVVILASCGGDATTQPGGLSQEQLASMTSALSFLLGTPAATPEARRGTLSASRARNTSAVQVPIAGSGACPEGGHIGLSGTFSADTAGSTFALTDTLVACGVKDNHSNVWTFTSKPTLSVSIVLPTQIHGDSIDVAHSTILQFDVGSVGYSTGAVSGTCAVDLGTRFEVDRGSPTADSTTSSLATTGSLCGQSVMLDTTLTTYTPQP